MRPMSSPSRPPTSSASSSVSGPTLCSRPSVARRLSTRPWPCTARVPSSATAWSSSAPMWMPSNAAKTASSSGGSWRTWVPRVRARRSATASTTVWPRSTRSDTRSSCARPSPWVERDPASPTTRPICCASPGPACRRVPRTRSSWRNPSSDGRNTSLSSCVTAVTTSSWCAPSRISIPWACTRATPSPWHPHSRSRIVSTSTCATSRSTSSGPSASTPVAAISSSRSTPAMGVSSSSR